MTEWREIPDWPRYEASDRGEIRCALSGIILIPRPMGGPTRKDRRPSVMLLHCDGRYRWRIVGRLVCMAFHGQPPSPTHQAAHGNGISTDNRPENLRWATPLENNHDRYKHGTMPCGERAGRSVLTGEQAGALRARYAALKEAQKKSGKRKLPNGTIAKLASQFGVSRGTVMAVGRGESWAHL